MKHGTHPLGAEDAPMGAVGTTSLHRADAFLQSASARYRALFHARYASSICIAPTSPRRSFEHEAIGDDSLNCLATARSLVNTAVARLWDCSARLPESHDCLRLIPASRVLHREDCRQSSSPLPKFFTFQEIR